jgi:predicted RNase H-like HicB family nuclease
MTTYDIYLEINEAGNCLAHVPELAGCMVRGEDEVTAMAMLPQSIRSHIEWLLVHDIIYYIPDSIELNVVETNHNIGPFNADDGGVFFSVDSQSLTENDLGWYLRQAGENRAELLGLVSGLPEEILDWTGWDGGMSIGRVLQHIGRSEQCYLSRLTDAVTAEPESEDVFEFLATVYRWILIWIHHEREHAADLRKVLNLPDFPERLTHV